MPARGVGGAGRRAGGLAWYAGLLAMALLWVPVAAHAAVTVDVALPDGEELPPLEKVAVVPMICPPGFDCRELELDLEQELARRVDAEVLGSRAVLDVILELGIIDLDDEKVGELIERLGVDALLIPVIHHSGDTTDPFWRWLILSAGSRVMVFPTSVKDAQAELILVGAEPLGTLLRGAGRGAGRRASRARIVRQIFTAILDGAFGEPAE